MWIGREHPCAAVPPTVCWQRPGGHMEGVWGQGYLVPEGEQCLEYVFMTISTCVCTCVCRMTCASGCLHMGMFVSAHTHGWVVPSSVCSVCSPCRRLCAVHMCDPLCARVPGVCTHTSTCMCLHGAGYAHAHVCVCVGVYALVHRHV